MIGLVNNIIHVVGLLIALSNACDGLAYICDRRTYTFDMVYTYILHSCSMSFAAYLTLALAEQLSG